MKREAFCRNLARFFSVVAIIFICATVFLLQSCGGDDIAVGGGAVSGDGESFLGIVLEKHEGVCLIEVSDSDSGALASGSTVYVSTAIDGCPPYEVGDSVRIVFDGKVAMSYPPQIFGVVSIEVLE